MFIERKPVGVYGANAYVLASENRESIIIDPGGEPEEIEKIIEENNLKPKYIVLTHGHGDHIYAAKELKEKYKIDILVHEDDAELLENCEKNLTTMMPVKEPVEIYEYTTLKDGDNITFGDKSLKVIHTPGHTRGCICLKIDDNIFTGDTLFKGSIGRTDLYGGGDDIISSIKEKIIVFDDDTKVFPGHGAISTIGYEKNTNPFIKKADYK